MAAESGNVEDGVKEEVRWQFEFVIQFTYPLFYFKWPEPPVLGLGGGRLQVIVGVLHINEVPHLEFDPRTVSLVIVMLLSRLCLNDISLCEGLY